MFGLDAIAGIVKAISNVSIVGIIAHMASEKVFHFNAFTFLLITTCLCAIAVIVSHLKPKPTLPTIDTKNLTNIPIDYQDYLKHKALSDKYDAEESFSFIKFFSGFGQAKNWAKAIVIGAMIAILLGIGVSVYKEVNSIFGKKPVPVVSTITNTGDGKVESKTESKSEAKSSNGLNLNIFSSWF